MDVSFPFGHISQGTTYLQGIPGGVLSRLTEMSGMRMIVVGHLSFG